MLCDYTFAYGDVDAALARSAEVFTDSFGFTRIHHFHLEPHVNVARWTGDRLEMWSCNQDPFIIRADLARVFGVKLHDVCLHTPPVGGGFGGKSYCKMEPLVALMAREAGAPVRLGLTFDESILTTTKHAAVLTLTTGVDAAGRLTARRAEIELDGGAYADASITVAIKAGFRIGGPYRWAAIDSKARVVRTNCVPGGSFRGFGGTQASWASERQIDMIARRRGIDPFEFRMRNFLAVNEPYAPGDSGMDSDLRAGLTEAAELLDAAGPCPSGRGRGFAVGLKDAGGTGNHAQAVIKVTQGGEAIVSAAVVEIGQGAGVALCRIAAETLGIGPENVAYAEIDTDHSPPDNGTHVSCGTTVTGLAVEAGGARRAAADRRFRRRTAGMRLGLGGVGRLDRPGRQPCASAGADGPRLVRRHGLGIHRPRRIQGAVRRDCAAARQEHGVDALLVGSRGRGRPGDPGGVKTASAGGRRGRRQSGEPACVPRADRGCGDAGTQPGDVRGTAVRRVRCRKTPRRAAIGSPRRRICPVSSPASSLSTDWDAVRES